MKETVCTRLLTAVFVVLVGLLFVACGSSGFQVVLDASLEPTSLKLNVGEKREFTPVVNAIGSYSVTWESSNPSVASVNDDGMVTAHTVGETELTATFTDSITDTVLVEVVEPDIVEPDIVEPDISVEELALLSFGFKLADNSFTPRRDPEVGDFSQPLTEAGDAVVLTIPLDYKGVDLSDLVPSFETTPGAEVYVGRERQTSGESSNDFSGPAPVIYTLKKGASIRSYSIEVELSTLFLIPDATFRDYLKREFPDAFEGELLDTTAASVRSATSINVGDNAINVSDNARISSLSGIEFFPALEVLYCDSTGVTSLDVSGNPALMLLFCSWTKLTSLDVSGNPALVLLDCSWVGSLTSLDVSDNPKLAYFDCSGTGVTTLDVSGNPKLKRLFCSETSLTSLDVSGKPALEWVNCDNTSLTSLDVSDNPKLEILDCSWASLTSLDVSDNTKLRWLSCRGNNLTTLNLSGIRRGTARITIDIDAGVVYTRKTWNPLTTLIVHESLRNHGEVNEAIRNRGSALSVTYVK